MNGNNRTAIPMHPLDVAQHFFDRVMASGQPKPKQTPGERELQKTIDTLSKSLVDANRANPLNQLSITELEAVCKWFTICEIARETGFSEAVPGLRKIASAANQEWHRRQEGMTTEGA